MSLAFTTQANTWCILSHALSHAPTHKITHVCMHVVVTNAGNSKEAKSGLIKMKSHHKCTGGNIWILLDSIGLFVIWLSGGQLELKISMKSPLSLPRVMLSVMFNTRESKAYWDGHTTQTQGQIDTRQHLGLAEIQTHTIGRGGGRCRGERSREFKSKLTFDPIAPKGRALASFP